MKNSFSLLEVILTLIISSIVIIYSTLFAKELFFEKQDATDTTFKEKMISLGFGLIYTC